MNDINNIATSQNDLLSSRAVIVNDTNNIPESQSNIPVSETNIPVSQSNIPVSQSETTMNFPGSSAVTSGFFSKFMKVPEKPVTTEENVDGQPTETSQNEPNPLPSNFASKISAFTPSAFSPFKKSNAVPDSKQPEQSGMFGMFSKLGNIIPVNIINTDPSLNATNINNEVDLENTAAGETAVEEAAEEENAEPVELTEEELQEKRERTERIRKKMEELENELNTPKVVEVVEVVAEVVAEPEKKGGWFGKKKEKKKETTEGNETEKKTDEKKGFFGRKSKKPETNDTDKPIANPEADAVGYIWVQLEIHAPIIEIVLNNFIFSLLFNVSLQLGYFCALLSIAMCGSTYALFTYFITLRRCLVCKLFFIHNNTCTILFLSFSLKNSQV